MSQVTRVFELTKAQAEGLRKSLQESLASDVEWRHVPHARFSLKAEGVVLTCYQSGKLVLQGRDLDGFCARFLSGLNSIEKKQRSEQGLELQHPTIGSDEAGKGDYFGPLVVAAFYCRPEDTAELDRMGIRDSKALSDERCKVLAAQLEDHFDHRLRVMMPTEYNPAYQATGNLNDLLADLHAGCLKELAAAHPEAEELLVDKFANEALLGRRLKEVTSAGPRLTQVTRAERHHAVAAASIIARAAFLAGLEECSDSSGSELAKGAGTPVDRAAQRVHEIGGMSLLTEVAKIHFRNTDKIPGIKR